jgi:hypothetical protein
MGHTTRLERASNSGFQDRLGFDQTRLHPDPGSTVRQNHIQSVDERVICEEIFNEILADQFGDLKIHSVETGDTVVRSKAVPDFLHAMDDLCDRIRRP